MRKLLYCLALLAIASAVHADMPKMVPVVYQQWGFSGMIPEGSAKQSMSHVPHTAGMYDAYTFNGIGYVFFVEKAPSNVEPRVAIEQILAILTMIGAQNGVTRWTVENEQGSQFQGFSLYARNSKESAMPEAWITELLKGEPVATSQSVAIIDNKLQGADRFVVGVGCIGPKSRLSNIESAAKYLTQNLKWLNPKYATGKDKTEGGSTSKVTFHAKLTVEAGKIGLCGVVDTVSGDGKSLSVLVDEVTSPGKSAIKLNPARAKTILLTETQTGLEPGVRIAVIGADTGKGKPVVADSVQFVK